MSDLVNSLGSLSGVFAESFARELGKQSARRVLPPTTNVNLVGGNVSCGTSSPQPSVLKSAAQAVAQVETSDKNLIPRPLVAGAALAVLPLCVNYLSNALRK
jgi:hypothetical protein